MCMHSPINMMLNHEQHSCSPPHATMDTLHFSLRTDVCVLIPCRRCTGTLDSPRWPLQDLHGCHYRLCSPWVWAHGDLHQVWQEDEWMSDLQAVCCQSRACLQVVMITTTLHWTVENLLSTMQFKGLVLIKIYFVNVCIIGNRIYGNIYRSFYNLTSQ